mgnify:CR=1 FL=1
MKTLDPRKHCEFHCIRHNTNKVLEEFYEKSPTKEVVEKEYDRFV